MQSEISFSDVAPPLFEGENYQVWAIRMESYLEANDIWEAVEEDYEITPLPANPTVAQIKNHKKKRQRKSKAKSCLFNVVSATIFTRIMTLKSAKEIWDFLKTEYEDNEKIKGMRVLNLIREYEMQRMKESETIKEYSDRLLSIVNQVRLLSKEVSDSRIVQKILVTIPERFESTISSLEISKDVSSITLAELLNALQAQEQRRLMRLEGTVEGALAAKLHISHNNKGEKRNGKKSADYQAYSKGKGSDKQDYPSCQHCGKKGHPPHKCWRRPDVRCNKCKLLGHIAKICKSKEKYQQSEAQFVEKKEDKLFVASYFATSIANESWLIDSGCTNHMTHDIELFKELNNAVVSQV
ncbi:receptor-like protein 12-like [Hibiscus syriacus]|uniref:Receptor-like protein 12-like n=1 Tax=Hibiscus syriacus TaxID=106335 RepID=A0A6A3CJX9_HIBSY|nr:receptor-like protein 12-like [Hibiscus syriacus]